MRYPFVDLRDKTRLKEPFRVLLSQNGSYPRRHPPTNFYDSPTQAYSPRTHTYFRKDSAIILSLVLKIQSMKMKAKYFSLMKTKRKCSVCLHRPSTHAFNGCGHKCLCVTCSQSYQMRSEGYKCVICRSFSNKIIEIYET